MSLTKKTPGMVPGSTVRNLLVGYGYFLGALISILLFPVILGVVVGKNYWSAAEKLAKVPGIDPNGGVKSGGIALVFGFVIWSVVFGAAGEDDDIDSLDDLESELEQNDIHVSYLDGGDHVFLDYYSPTSTEQIDQEEVRIIALSYAALVDSGYESEYFHVIFMDSQGSDLGGYTIFPDWAQDYNDGDISEKEYLELILDMVSYD
ncbi:hypothetical protein [Natronococcus amylolyticus]|uniref:hypothetical protein n=1 Tax=Natronococcus amylolyticus TaxID=44470 RepID=UPI001267E697|nr:hypothetical protein [Natronococcus amylolyticus]